MGFVCCHRDRPGSAALRQEERWSYLDRFPGTYAGSEVHRRQFGGRSR